MATTKNWKQKLSSFEGAVVEHRDPHLEVIRCGSPSVNALFGNSGAPNRGHGLPRGFSLLMGGPPKGGKSTLVNSFISQFQKDYPELYVIKIDTEFKESVQTDVDDVEKWGIDEDRYICYERNDVEIADFITNDVQKMVQDGFPLGLLINDSFSQMEGFRASDAATAKKAASQIGDNARTAQTLMARILPFIRKHKIGFIGTAHVGAELDQVEQMRGNKLRIKTAAGTNHRIEYWMMVERDRSAAGKKDLLDREYVREDAIHTGKEGKQSDVYAHNIKAEMVGSSFGPIEREARFTYDYQRGIINQHEEVFTLAKQNDIITLSGLTYSFDGKDFRGKPAMLAALESDKKLYQAVLDAVMILDSGGHKIAAK